jgi:serine/threonine protein phosphatase 1
MNGIVQRYERNVCGRDFVVGDIHGCFDQLRAVLEAAGFLPECDRLFSVGDLIDRGPQSTETLQWLARPWFHAILGNHEDMALQSPYDREFLMNWVMLNGGDWWLDVEAGARAEYLAAFRRLPLAMEIETARGRVGIVHADIQEGTGWPAFLAALEAGDAAARQTALWSRRRADAWVNTPVEGIDRVVCGHTITPDRMIHRLANVWFIDTGAFLTGTSGGHLTLLGLERLFTDGDSSTPGRDETVQ